MVIQIAAHHGDLPMVRCLVEEFRAQPWLGAHGAQPTLIAHSSNRPAFVLALMHGHIPVVEYLVARYAAGLQNVRLLLLRIKIVFCCDHL